MEIYDPTKYLRLIFPKDFFKGKILNNDLKLKQEMMQALIKSAGISKREVNQSVYKVVDKYLEKIKELKAEGEKSYKKKALNNEVLLKNRLENLVLWNEVQHLKEEHAGQYYRWLPSSAEEPDPEHQLLYGKIFKVGEGDNEGNMPTERYGCKCGIEFLEDKNEIEEVENMEEPKIPIEAEYEEIKFNPLKNIEESEKYAENFIDKNKKNKIFENANFKGIDIENQNIINETLTEIYEKLNISGVSGFKTIDPESATGKKIFTSSDALAAYSPVYKGIYINKKIVKNQESIDKYFGKSKETFEFIKKNKNKLTKEQIITFERYEKAGRALVDESLKGAIIHEYGHFIQWEILPVKLNNELGKMENAELISGYAGATKGEYIAESFAAYMKGEKKYLNKEFVKFLDGLLKK